MNGMHGLEAMRRRDIHRGIADDIFLSDELKAVLGERKSGERSEIVTLRSPASRRTHGASHRLETRSNKVVEIEDGASIPGSQCDACARQWNPARSSLRCIDDATSEREWRP
jgi:hypothetical protein